MCLWAGTRLHHGEVLGQTLQLVQLDMHLSGCAKQARAHGSTAIRSKLCSRSGVLQPSKALSCWQDKDHFGLLGSPTTLSGGHSKAAVRDALFVRALGRQRRAVLACCSRAAGQAAVSRRLCTSRHQPAASAGVWNASWTRDAVSHSVSAWLKLSRCCLNVLCSLCHYVKPRPASPARTAIAGGCSLLVSSSTVHRHLTGNVSNAPGMLETMHKPHLEGVSFGGDLIPAAHKPHQHITARRPELDQELASMPELYTQTHGHATAAAACRALTRGSAAGGSAEWSRAASGPPSWRQGSTPTARCCPPHPSAPASGACPGLQSSAMRVGQPHRGASWGGSHSTRLSGTVQVLLVP